MIQKDARHYHYKDYEEWISSEVSRCRRPVPPRECRAVAKEKKKKVESSCFLTNSITARSGPSNCGVRAECTGASQSGLDRDKDRRRGRFGEAFQCGNHRGTLDGVFFIFYFLAPQHGGSHSWTTSASEPERERERGRDVHGVRECVPPLGGLRALTRRR